MEANAEHIECGAPIRTLKEWKAEQGWTWVWLASRSGVSYPSLMHWARSGRISEDARGRIAEALGIRPHQISN